VGGVKSKVVEKGVRMGRVGLVGGAGMGLEGN